MSVKFNQFESQSLNGPVDVLLWLADFFASLLETSTVETLYLSIIFWSTSAAQSVQKLEPNCFQH